MGLLLVKYAGMAVPTSLQAGEIPTSMSSRPTWSTRDSSRTGPNTTEKHCLKKKKKSQKKNKKKIGIIQKIH